MNETALLVIRGLAGGTLVVLFALVAEVLSPKAFSGLFSAAPSVAFTSLAFTAGFQSVSKAHAESTGMVLGAMGMVASCVIASLVIPRLRAFWGSLLAWIVWGMVSLGLYWSVFVNAH